MATKEVKYHISQQGAENVSGKFGGVEKSLTSMAKSAMGTVASIYTLKKAFDFTVSAAIKQEEIFRKLQTSVELTGKSWDSAKGELDQMFASLQATTQYGDTESAAVFTTLTQLTSDYDKSVKGLPMVLDLAATGLFDTGTAAKYVAMAMEGNVTMLGRYIPELKAENNEIVKNGTAAEKSAEFMRIFNEKFAGTAQKNLQSTAGQMKQLQNYLGDIGEAIGDNVLPAINSMVGGLVKLLNNSNPVSDNLKIQIDKSSELRTEFENLAHTVLFLAEKESLSNEEMKIRDNAILKLQSQYPNYFNNLINEKDNYENLKTAISNARKSLIDYTNQMVQTAVVSKYTDQITDLTTKIIDNKTSIAELEIANDRLRTQINKTYEEQQISNQAIIQNNMLIEMAKILNDDYAEKLKNLEERFKLAKEEAAKFSQTIAPSSESINKINKISEDISKLPLLFELSTEAANKYHKGISELEIIDIPKQEKLFNELLYINTDYTSAYVQEWIKGNEAEIQSTQKFINQASSALGSFSNYQSTLANNRIREAQDAAEAEIAAIQESGKSEEQKEREIAQVKANLRELEKAELAKQKPIKYAQAVSNTALGVTQALASSPPPFSFVLAAMVAAAGAAEIATIAAQKYATGGIVPGAGNKDTIPAMLTPGEVILNQAQQSNLVQNMGGITINVQGNLVATEEEADRFAKIIQERSKLGYNRIAVN